MPWVSSRLTPIKHKTMLIECFISSNHCGGKHWSGRYYDVPGKWVCKLRHIAENREHTCKLVTFWQNLPFWNQNRPFMWGVGVFFFFNGGRITNLSRRVSLFLDFRLWMLNKSLIPFLLSFILLGYLYCPIALCWLELGYNLKSLQIFRSFIRFAAARLNVSFMDFIHLRDSEIKWQLMDELFAMLTQSRNKRKTTVWIVV